MPIKNIWLYVNYKSSSFSRLEKKFSHYVGNRRVRTLLAGYATQNIVNLQKILDSKKSLINFYEKYMK